MSNNKEPLGDKILGTWKLLKFVYKDHQNQEDRNLKVFLFMKKPDI